MKGFLHPGRFLAVTLGGLGLGYIVAAVYCHWQPTVHRSTVLVAKTEPVIERTRLAPIHAALIRRDREDDHRQTLTLPAGDSSRAVSFLASPHGVEVEVLSDDPKKGIDLAVRAAGLFRGMEHEVALAAMDPDAIPHTSAEQREERREALQLRTLVNEDARAAGFAGVFALRERATRIGIDSIPGDPLTAPPAILTRQIEDPEYGPARIGRWLDRGMGTGLVLGLAAAFFLARRKPGTGNPQVDPLPEPVAEW